MGEPERAVAGHGKGLFAILFGGFGKTSRSHVGRYDRSGSGNRVRGRGRSGNPMRLRGRWMEGGRSFIPYFTPPSSPYQSTPQSESRSRGGVRTMCVRLCDGYYWPMTFSASWSQVRRDRRICEASCSAETRLFVIASYNDQIANMRDLSGRRYGRLANAFRYRKSLVDGCTCRPAPWSEAARRRHARYAALTAGDARGAAMGADEKQTTSAAAGASPGKASANAKERMSLPVDVGETELDGSRKPAAPGIGNTALERLPAWRYGAAATRERVTTAGWRARPDRGSSRRGLGRWLRPPGRGIEPRNPFAYR